MSETTISTPEIDGQIVLIERATPNDALAILKLKQATWLAAYPNAEHGVSEEDIRKKLTDEMIVESVEPWQKGIAEEDERGDRATFVARIDGEVVGYASPCIEDDQRRIGGLYVLPSQQDKGIGSTLLKKALEWHGADNDVYLHVVSYNENAIGLYKQFGFEKTGVEIPGDFDKQQDIKLLPEIEMVRKPKTVEQESRKAYSIECALPYNQDLVTQTERFRTAYAKLASKLDDENLSHANTLLVDDVTNDAGASYDLDNYTTASMDASSETLVMRESQLTSLADTVYSQLAVRTSPEDLAGLKTEQGYSSPFYISVWSLLRLGYLTHPDFPIVRVADKLFNILPEEFRPGEEQSMAIVRQSQYPQAANQVEYLYL